MSSWADGGGGGGSIYYPSTVRLSSPQASQPKDRRASSGEASLGTTSLNRFLRSLRSVGMTHETGVRNEEAPPTGGGANLG